MKRHTFDPMSFLFGLFFAGIGLVFLAGDFSLLDLGWQWIWPVPVLFLGGLMLALVFSRRGKLRQVDEGSQDSQA